MLNLAYALAEEGVLVEFVLTKKEGDFLDVAESKFRVVDLNSNRAYKHPFKLLMYIIKNRPNAVISNFWKHNLCACVTRIMFPVFKLLVVEHSIISNNPLLPSKVYYLTSSMFYRFSTRIISVSRGVANEIKKHSIGLSKKIQVIYNPIQPPILKQRNVVSTPVHLPYRLVSVGRLIPSKNINLLLEAFALVIKEIDAQLTIVGDGELKTTLESDAERLGISSSVLFTGYHSRPVEVLEDSDLFVLSSDYEGLPTVLIEALYCGLPIVSTDCPGGAREILQDGKFGRIVPVRDPIALAEAIVIQHKVVNNPIFQKQGVERFSPARIANEYMSVLGIH